MQATDDVLRNRVETIKAITRFFILNLNFNMKDCATMLGLDVEDFARSEYLHMKLRDERKGAQVDMICEKIMLIKKGLEARYSDDFSTMRRQIKDPRPSFQGKSAYSLMVTGRMYDLGLVSEIVRM